MKTAVICICIFYYLMLNIDITYSSIKKHQEYLYTSGNSILRTFKNAILCLVAFLYTLVMLPENILYHLYKKIIK